MKPISGQRLAVAGSPALETQPIRSDAFTPGEVVGGKYVIERVIGIGGVGVVLAAKHRELDETVAIKFLRPDVTAKPDLVRRFAREAKAAVLIKSEYAARVFDVGVLPDRGPYLVMEYLEGRDLADVVADGGPLPAKRAVEYVMQACEALAMAHANGIIHRDIKPENLFLARRSGNTEAVKVLDFGISKAALTGSVFGGDVSLVKTQDLMGSPLYMSPEQIRSTKNVDHRTDIWSLGVVLYELMTGRAPFQGETITKICSEVLEGEPPPLRAYMPEVPEGLQGVVDRCLQKVPNKRFQNVAELAVALLPFAPSLARVLAERASGILRASGQEVVTLKFESTAPPPAAGGAALAFPPTPGVPFIPSPPAAALTSTNPEALDAITAEARKTRRVVVAASAVVLLLLAGIAFFVLRATRQSAAVAANASEAVAHPVWVWVDSEPPGARVEWDGNFLGETPVEIQLPPGSHTLRITKETYLPENISITIAPTDKETRRCRVTLKKQDVVSATNAAATPPAPRAVLLPAQNGQNGKGPALRGGAAAPAQKQGAGKAGAVAQPSQPQAAQSQAGPPPPADTPAPTAAPPKVRMVDDGNRVHILDESTESKVPLVK